jgi:hypothetical protein
VQRAIVRFERFGREPAMAFAHKLRGPALGFDRLFDRQSIVGAVGTPGSSGTIEGAIATSASLAGVVSTARMMPLSLSAAMWAL